MRVKKEILLSVEQNTAILLAAHIDDFEVYVLELIAADFAARGLKFGAEKATGRVIQPEHLHVESRICARIGCENTFVAATDLGGREKLYCSSACKRKANFARWYADPANRKRQSQNVVKNRKAKRQG